MNGLFKAQEMIFTGNDVSISTSGTINENMRTSEGIIQGGKSLTASGTLKVPIVFVKFSDDNSTTTHWPNANSLPSWASNFIDSESPSNNIYQNDNFSKFCDLASGGDGDGNLGEFQVIGDVYFVTLNNTRSYYENNGKDPAVSEDVIDILNDPNGDFDVDFREYDNWILNKDGEYYNHEYSPFDPSTGESADSTLDMILLCWKEESISLPTAGGEATLGFSGTIIKDGINIKKENGIRGYKASLYGPDRFPFICAHEIGHHQFGMISGNSGSHFNGRKDSYGNFQRLGLMTLSEGSHFSAYEKYRLGWLDPIVVTTNTNNVIISDTHKSSSNNAVLIPVNYNTSGDLEEYYLIENYHTTNSYSSANPFLTESLFNHTFTKGLIVYHISGEDFDWPTLSKVDIEEAEGIFDWEVVEGASTPSNRLDDLIAKVAPNVTSGYNEREEITATAGTITYDDYYALTPESTSEQSEKEQRRYESNDWLSDQEDLFSINYNDVFTKWSNPSSIRDNGSDSNVGFEIVSYNSSNHTYTLNISTNSSGCEAFAPSKPQNLKISEYYNSQDLLYHPKLEWDANGESDMLRYEIYRKVDDGSWTYLTYVYYTSTSYIDYDVELSELSGADEIQYKIRAKDDDSKTSVYSETASCTGYEGILHKNKNEENDDIVIKEFKLNDNYPNPFNPSTQISYQLPKAEYVSLVVYNSLGQEVKTLVNKAQPSGIYNINFKADNLPSGVYIYKLKAGNFVNVKKMLLMK